MKTHTIHTPEEILHDIPAPLARTFESGTWNAAALPATYRFMGTMRERAMVLAVERGAVVLVVDDGARVRLSAGTMAIVPPSAGYLMEMETDTRMMTCSLGLELLQCELFSAGELQPHAEALPAGLHTLKIQGAMADYLRLMYAYQREGIESESLTALKKQEFLHLLFLCYSPRELAGFLQPLLGEDMRFRSFVAGHYAQVKNVQELAAKAGYSTSGFIKKFNRCFGGSPYRWMQEQRAGHIRLEINAGILSLKELSRKYHFSSYQHFSEFCKTHFGAPPTQLRKARKTGHINLSDLIAATKKNEYPMLGSKTKPVSAF